jgi:hypothetical protein
MIYGYSIPKCDSVRPEVFFYPREGRRRNGTEEKLESWFSQRKSTVGERPEANESECEDIDPPKRKMPAKVKFGRRSGGFCPCGRILFRGSTVAFRLGCWTAESAVTLDT